MLENGSDWLKFIFGPLIAGGVAWFTRGFFSQTARDSIEKRKGEAELDILGIYKKERDEERQRCVDLAKQMPELTTKRYEAEAESAVWRKRLDVAEAERDSAISRMDAANRHAAACEEVAQIFRTQIVALEKEARQMEIGSGPVAK